MRHAADVPLDQLAWNRLDARFWFHYTTVFASRLIAEQGHAAPAGTSLDLEDIVVGRAFQRDGLWRYDETLWAA